MPLPPPGKKISNRKKASAKQAIDYEQMVIDCTREIENDETNYKAFYHRGVAYRIKGDHARAVKDLTSAIELNHRYIDALRERGECYLALGHPDYAARDFRDILKFEPKNPDAWNMLGEAKARTSEYQDAIEFFTKAIELNPKHAKAYFNRGEAHISRGQYAAACYNKGYSYYHQAKFDKALAEFNAGIKADPDFEILYLGKGQTLEAMGLSRDALIEYRNIISRATEPNAWHVEHARKLMNMLLDRIKG